MLSCKMKGQSVPLRAELGFKRIETCFYCIIKQQRFIVHGFEMLNYGYTKHCFIFTVLRSTNY